MGLEHLDSIFNEDLAALAEDYEANQSLNTGFSTMVPDVTQPTQNPILDQFSRLPSSFIGVPSSFNYTPASDLPAFRMQTFDPRIPKNNRIQINTINTYAGTIHTPTIVTDYSTAGKFDNNYTPQTEVENPLLGSEDFYSNTTENDLGGLGLDLRASLGWWSLYTHVHQARTTDFTSVQPKAFQPYHYGSNVNRDKLNIRKKATAWGLLQPNQNFRNEGFGFGESEPYLVFSMDEMEPGPTGGSRSLAMFRAANDRVRLTSFLTSPAGLAFIVKQNLQTIVPNTVVRADTKDLDFLAGVGASNGRANYDGDQLRRVPQRFNASYNPLSTLAANSFFGVAVGVGKFINIRKDDPTILPWPLQQLNWGAAVREYGVTGNPYLKANSIPFRAEDSFRGGGSAGRFRMGNNPLSNIVNQPYNEGDVFTLAERISGYGFKTTMASGTQIVDETGKVDSNNVSHKLNFNVESEKHGMPLYFKDLRTEEYLFFRAYISGITENVTPSWAPTNYIGRSEPVWVYERGERDVSFILKIFAQTADELQSIYKKINHLTSLCYPQYMQDVGMSGYGSGAYKQYRMKPPLVKFRMGEVYGDANREQLSYIKSLTYTIPDETIWEVRAGARVPKYITAAISLQILHESNHESRLSPGYGTRFMGYKGDFRPGHSRQSRRARDLATTPVVGEKLINRDTHGTRI